MKTNSRSDPTRSNSYVRQPLTFLEIYLAVQQRKDFEEIELLFLNHLVKRKLMNSAIRPAGCEMKVHS